MKNLVILISGKQGSGKSTFSKALIKSLDDTFEGTHSTLNFKFADPLYDIQAAIRGVLTKDYDFHEMPEKDGDLLQLLGTEWGRKKYGENLWVKLAQKSVAIWQAKARLMNQGLIAVFDDCRFENEFHAFDDLLVLKIRLNASEEIRKVRADSWRETTWHASEVSLDKYQDEGKFDLSFQTIGGGLDAMIDVVKDKIKDLKI